jgi:hypothetical protein
MPIRLCHHRTFDLLHRLVVRPFSRDDHTVHLCGLPDSDTNTLLPSVDVFTNFRGSPLLYFVISLDPSRGSRECLRHGFARCRASFVCSPLSNYNSAMRARLSCVPRKRETGEGFRNAPLLSWLAYYSLHLTRFPSPHVPVESTPLRDDSRRTRVGRTRRTPTASCCEV